MLVVRTYRRTAHDVGDRPRVSFGEVGRLSRGGESQRVRHQADVGRLSMIELSCAPLAARVYVDADRVEGVTGM